MIVLEILVELFDMFGDSGCAMICLWILVGLFIIVVVLYGIALQVTQ